MRVCLFEDSAVLDFEPLTLTRPVFELLCGLTTLGAKQSRFSPAGPRGVLIRPELAEVYRGQASIPVNDLGWLRAAPTVLVNGRWLPPALPSQARSIRIEESVLDLSGPCVGLVGDEVAYVAIQPDQLPDCSAESLEESLAHWRQTLPSRPAGGRLFRHLWELVQHNGEQIGLDWQTTGAPAEFETAAEGRANLTVVGPREQVAVHPSARIDPLVVADTTGGPIVIEREAVIEAFTRLEGPCRIGAKTQVQGARVRGGTTIGPDCRIGGEIEASIVQGHSNKYHDGFLGHAYVGAWVNLGAGTSNSDLRNDYGEVTVTVQGEPVGTGLTKVGCFLGDHTKSGLGTLLNTGTSAGVFCHLLPGGLLPKYLPSFASWWNEALADRADLASLLQTAAEVMRRRNVVLTEAHATLYRTLFAQTAPQRRRAVREAERRTLRRSA